MSVCHFYLRSGGCENRLAQRMFAKKGVPDSRASSIKGMPAVSRNQAEIKLRLNEVRLYKIIVQSCLQLAES